jgi:coenzyme PQQ biosynthesis protein PqqD
VTSLPHRPRLAARARLHFDRHAGAWLLLYPERGLALNATAAAVVRLLTGEHGVDAIVDRVHSTAPDAARAVVARDVRAFLERLRDRRLLEDGG